MSKLHFEYPFGTFFLSRVKEQSSRTKPANSLYGFLCPVHMNLAKGMIRSWNGNYCSPKDASFTFSVFLLSILDINFNDHGNSSW